MPSALSVVSFEALIVLIIERPIEEVTASKLERFARRAQELAGVSGTVDILITDNHRLQELNRRFRKKNKPTDVLSFPRQSEGGGDIAISAEIAVQNASVYGHAAGEEFKVLILHGMLHLAGYDHERDNGEMAARETALRRRLGLPTALIERGEPPMSHHRDAEKQRRLKPKASHRRGRRGHRGNQTN